MFESHFVRVVRYVEGQLSDHAIAEEIAAETFRVAWQKLDPKDPFGLPWLIRTAMHKTRDHQRRTYRGAAAIDAVSRALEEPAEELDPLDGLALRAALMTLSDRDVRIVQLTYWVGLSAGEVAAVMHMKEGAVWTRLHRARARLRSALADGSTAEGGSR